MAKYYWKAICATQAVKYIRANKNISLIHAINI